MARLSIQITPSLAWLGAFLPALLYFCGTRMSHAGFRVGRSYTLGELITSRVDNMKSCSVLSQVFFLSCDTNELTYGLYKVQDDLHSLVDSVWKHDSELGRGYLLLSDSAGSGRIWRWEVGGGPIAIGKTLHMEQSGCRFKEHCLAANNMAIQQNGSGGMAIDFHGKDHPNEGRLVVMERGERRIVRLEENGARTPLVIQIPDVCKESVSEGSSTTTAKVQESGSLIFTRHGHLLFLEKGRCGVGAVFEQKFATYFTPLPSLAVSRQAHEWNAIESSSEEYMLPDPTILYQPEEGSIGGMALSPTLRSLCVTVLTEHGVLLHQIPYTNGDDDTDDILSMIKEPIFAQWKAVNLTQHGLSWQETEAPIAVSQQGRVFVGLDQAIAVLDPVENSVLGILPVPEKTTSLTLGEDGFLYSTSSRALYRIATRDKPIQLPVDKIQPPAKKRGG